MAVTDIGLSIYYHYKFNTPLFNSELLLNYVLYAGLIAIGKWMGKGARFWKLLFGGILGSAIFFFVTNTLSWLQNPQYAKTLAGWIQAWFIGLPGYPPSWEFFRNTLLSSGLFTALFVGTAKVTEESPAEKTAGVAEPENEETADDAVKG